MSAVKFTSTDGSAAQRLDQLNAPGAILVQSGDKKNIQITADHTYFGFNYQTFGIWMTGIGTNTGSYGVFTIGAPTAGSTIPTTGKASFAGALGGIYVTKSGAAYEVAASAIYVADFVNRTVQMSSSNSSAADIFSGSLYSASILNMSGVMSYSPGINAFSGTLSATGLSGQGNGRFYGPNATELGGTFYLTGTNGNFIGSFGGK